MLQAKTTAGRSLRTATRSSRAWEAIRTGATVLSFRPRRNSIGRGLSATTASPPSRAALASGPSGQATAADSSPVAQSRRMRSAPPRTAE